MAERHSSKKDVSQNTSWELPSWPASRKPRKRTQDGMHLFTLRACLPWHASNNKTMFPRSPQTVLPTGGHVFKFWKLWRTPHSNHHTALLEDQEFDSQHPGRATHNYLLTLAPPDPTPLTSTSSHARADTHRHINKNKWKKTAVSKVHDRLSVDCLRVLINANQHTWTARNDQSTQTCLPAEPLWGQKPPAGHGAQCEAKQGSRPCTPSHGTGTIYPELLD